MKKKVIGILVAIGIFSLGICFERMNSEFKNITKMPSGSGSMIAMYIQDEDGNYQLSDAREFPKDGYVLNTEKSSCKNGGKITQNSSTKALSLKVKTSDECTVYFEKEKATVIAYNLKANPVNTNYEDGLKSEMYTFDHDELTTTTKYSGTTYTYSATQVADWTSEQRRDYRYIGANPNNYITFNDETWRIIGVFTVENESGDKEQLIKIIRNQPIEQDLIWDMNNSNDWSTASLQNMLNDYYNKEKFTYKNCLACDTLELNGLKASARSQVAKVKWYLGGATNWSGLGAPNYYTFERGTTVYSGHTTSIIKNVGLMYPSDYVYTYANGVDTTCFTSGSNCGNGTPSAGWLFNNDNQWLLSPAAGPGQSYISFMVYSNGYVGIHAVTGVYPVRPSLYLSSSVKIIGGDGSQGNPYILLGS